MCHDRLPEVSRSTQARDSNCSASSRLLRGPVCAIPRARSESAMRSRFESCTAMAMACASEVFARHDAADEPRAQRFVGIDAAASQDHVRGETTADQWREVMKGAVGLEQPASELGQYEIGLGLAIRRSSARVNSSPKPTAGPLMAATRRLAGQREFARDVLQLIDGLLQRLPDRVRPLARPPRSWPAQNARPAPVTTRARQLVSPSSRVAMACRSSYVLRRNALSRSGRSMVATAMPSCTSIWMSLTVVASRRVTGFDRRTRFIPRYSIPVKADSPRGRCHGGSRAFLAVATTVAARVRIHVGRGGRRVCDGSRGR